MLKWLGIGVVVLVLVVVGGAGAYSWFINPRVERELREDPHGERAKKVMLITMPSGRTFPVNYLREGNTVYAAADSPWWWELDPDGGRGSVFIKGEELPGTMHAVVDDPKRREDVFGRLRPTAPLIFGTLVVIDLDE